MRRDEHGPPARIAFLVGADDGLDEFAAHDRIEASGRLVEHEQLGLGADRGDQRELRRWPFDRCVVFWRGSSLNRSSSALSVARFQRARKAAK